MTTSFPVRYVCHLREQITVYNLLQSIWTGLMLKVSISMITQADPTDFEGKILGTETISYLVSEEFSSVISCSVLCALAHVEGNFR